MAKLVLENVTKYFDNVCAVNDLSLEVEDGEFLVILGPSGAGKTTTLKLIGGVETLSSGKIFIGGKLMNAVEPHKRNVAMAFESYALYPHLTVAQNIAFSLRAPGRKTPEAEIAQKVDHITNLLGIGMLKDRLPKMLSNGQKQRVALGRAMVRDPEVLMLDEPISHLDAKLRHRMRTEFKALESDIRATTIYVTHDYLEALSLGDRLVVMEAGQIQQLGKPQELFHNPANTFVAKILGHPQINLIHCNVHHENGQLRLISGDGQITMGVPDRLRDPLLNSNLDQVIVGVRPLHVSESAGENEFEGTVYVYERLGTKGILSVTAGNQQMDVLTPIERNYEIDEHVRLTIDHRQISLFNPNTETNILFA